MGKNHQLGSIIALSLCSYAFVLFGMGAAVDIKADELAFVDETIGVELQISLAMGFLDQNWIGDMF